LKTVTIENSGTPLTNILAFYGSSFRASVKTNVQEVQKHGCFGNESGEKNETGISEVNISNSSACIQKGSLNGENVSYSRFFSVYGKKRISLPTCPYFGKCELHRYRKIESMGVVE